MNRAVIIASQIAQVSEDLFPFHIISKIIIPLITSSM